MQDNADFFQRDYFDQTTVHPIGVAALGVLAALVLLVPRKWAALPFLLLACFIPSAQRVVLVGLDFTFLRLLVMAGWIRLLTRREIAATWQAPDTVIVLWALARLAAYSLLRGDAQAVVYSTGQAFDALGLYFLFRNLIRGWPDIDRLVRVLALVAVPVALAFLLERSTGVNAFAQFGGVPEITMERDGKLRCQGAFDHPILAGCFFASFLPLLGALWWNRGRLLAATGIGGCLVVIFACASSTPVLAVGAGVFAACLFPFRSIMRWIALGAAVALIGLHLVMKAPVWHLISRIDVVGGSTSYHRYAIIDEAIKRFPDWALIGVRGTGDWGYYMFDVTNQYVAEGVDGGALTLALFVTMLALLFARAARLWRRHARSRGLLVFSWALGVALFVHSATFFAASYFGSILVAWHLLLATIVSLSEPRPVAAPSRALVAARPRVSGSGAG
jgi:hypothetical protein